MTTKPDMDIAWAENAAAPDIDPPDNTKLALGWLGENLPPHNYFNFQQNRADEYLKHLDENGIPDWDSLTSYSLAKGSVTKGSDGVTYRSKTEANVGNDPSGGGDTVNWEVWVPPAATTAEVITGTETNKYVSPFTFEQGLVARDLPDLVRAPTNISPADTAINISNPTLIADDYAAIYGVLQKSSQFQVATDALMLNIVYDSGEIAATQEHTVPGGTLSTLTQYHWWVRYRSEEDVWSGYSLVTTFTTAAVLTYVNQPTITFPTNGSTDITKRPLLTGSVFSTVGGADTHTSSRWQIALDINFNTLIYDTGDISDLESHQIVSGVLDGLISYYVRVKYNSLTFGSSAFSPANLFTTTDIDTDWLNYDGTEDGVRIDMSQATAGLQGLSLELSPTLLLFLDNLIGFTFRRTENFISTIDSSINAISKALGCFPAHNGIITSTTELSLIAEDGVFADTFTITPTLTNITPAYGNDGYVQFSDYQFYRTSNTVIRSYIVNEAGTNVATNTIDFIADKLAMQESKKYIIGLKSAASTSYTIESFLGGALAGVTSDSVTRSILPKLNQTFSIEFFQDGYFGVFWINNTNQTLVDIYQVADDGTITQVSVDHVLTASVTVTIEGTTRVPDGLVLISTGIGRHVVSYDSVLDIVAIESEVLTSAEGLKKQIFTLSDDAVFAFNLDGVDGVQILSARV